jgi:hypothetical protein
MQNCIIYTAADIFFVQLQNIIRILQGEGVIIHLARLGAAAAVHACASLLSALLWTHVLSRALKYLRKSCKIFLAHRSSLNLAYIKNKVTRL